MNREKKIFAIKSQQDFESTALDVFRFQTKENLVYKTYLEYLKIDVSRVKELEKIPFLPIEFFKTHTVISGRKKWQNFFESSGTTGKRSRHFIKSLELYEKSFAKTFKIFFGKPSQYCILALLPNYLENKHSSLIYMMDRLISKSKHPKSNFYLSNFKQLSEIIKELEVKKQKTILMGVSYALLDFAESFPTQLSHTLIMETGGMKGRREEKSREELHHFLEKNFGVKKIYSEYGMTEILSQAYALENGIFTAPPWMKIMIRDVQDPFTFVKKEKKGGINIIDLANIHTCSFIETKDIGKLYNDDTFEVLGRFDDADIRGCNLLYNEV